MNRDRLQELLNRSLDGAVSVEERVQLARALKADPLLRAEFEELKVTHRCIESLFTQLRLPAQFAGNVMRRIQPGHVPTDADLTALGEKGPRLAPIRRLPIAAPPQKRSAFAMVAAMAAAASLFVGIGVLISSLGSDSTPDRSSSPDSPRVAGDSENTRTDSRDSGSEGVDAPSPDKGDGASRHTNDGESIPEKKVVKKGPEPEPKQPLPPTDEVKQTPEPKDEPREVEPPRDEVKAPEPKDEPRKPLPPTDEVKKTPEPADEPGPTKAREIIVVGTVAVLNGKVTVRDVNGTSRKLSGTFNMSEGSILETSSGGLAVLYFESGSIAIGKASRVEIAGEGSVILEKGQVALDRALRGGGGGPLSVGFKGQAEYMYYLDSGTSVLTLKRKKFEVESALGFGYVSYDAGEIGTMLLEGSCEIEITFGKELKEPRAKAVRIPDWSAEARATKVLAQLDERIQLLTSREQKYMLKTIRPRLMRLLRTAMKSEMVYEFLYNSLDNEKLTVPDLAWMIRELESVIGKYKNDGPDLHSGDAVKAAEAASGTTEWKDYCAKLRAARHPVAQPKLPKAPAKMGGNKKPADCPKGPVKKMKRVDKPEKKPTK